jgi:hypothetical protein
MVSSAKSAPAIMEEGCEYFPPIEVHEVRSRFVAQTFRILVMRPSRRKGEDSRYPVVYTTDGNSTFDALKGISYSMQASSQTVPPFILVGICYPGDSPVAGAVLRTRDLTFPQYPEFRMEPPRIDGVLIPEEGTKDVHGAEDFQQFIAGELIPLIDQCYETIPGDRTYFGHSAGGGFGLFTLFTRPELFRNYVVSSAGLVYHGKSSAGVDYDNYDFLLQDARKFVASGRSLEGTRVYMSVGAEEEFEPSVAQWQLTSSFYRLAALLRSVGIPGMELTTEVLAGETHMTAWPIAFIHGVRAVFRGRQTA